jgi:FG-GAP-like repeat/Bacterial Ig-like domain (group 3)
LLSLLACPQTPAQSPNAPLRATEVTLKFASPDELPRTGTGAGTFITVTASVRSGGRAVSPGTVLFCDADAPFCEDGAILGKGQLGPDGTAVLRLGPAALARHRNLKAVFDGTVSYAISASGVIPLTVPDPPYPATTHLVASGAPSNYTLTATVQGGAYSDASIPPGQVSFVNTSTSQTLGTVNLNSGMEVVNYSASEESGTTHANPVAMVLADFNNDGLTDTATANVGAADVDVLLSDGFGGLTPSGPALTSGSKPTSIATADFNHDGNMDLVVNNSSGTGITVYLGAGDGTFTTAATPPSTLASPTAVAVGDFNHDGNMDIAVAGSNRVEILLGNGTGHFVRQGLTYVVNTPISLAVADFNGDHFDDLAVGAEGTHNLYILQSNGDGSFHVAQTLGTFTTPVAIVAGDFNGDGKPDLNVIDSTGRKLTTLLNRGTGTFLISSTWTTGTAPTAALARDLNADGNMDLAVTISGWNKIMLLYGTGTGHFHLGGYLPTSSQPSSIGVGYVFSPETYDPDASLVIADRGSSIVEEKELSYYGQSSASLSHVSHTGTGTYSVVAEYSGGGDWDPGNSSPVHLTSYLKSTTVFTLSASTVAAGKQVTLTGKVTANGKPVTSGVVHFCSASSATCSGSAAYGPANVNSSGVAVLKRTFKAGTYHINARFTATGTDTGSTSSMKTLKVTP